MVDNITLGVDTAHSNTRVGTLEIDTGQGWGTFTVDNTLRSACGRSTKVSWEAGAHRARLHHSALRIWSAGRWLARISRLRRVYYSRNQGTLSKWVSSVTLVAFTNSIVIGYLAFSVDTTCSGAWILALGVDTGLVLGTVKAEETLWLATYERVSLVVSDTLADSLTTLLSALCISAARTRIARVLWSGGFRHHWLLGAPGEWIPHSARRTAADGVVVLDFAHREHTTGSWAGVYALLSNAGKRAGAVRVLETLCLAALVRGEVPLVASPTAAHNLPRPVLATLCVGATWRGVARVLRSAALEGVSTKAWVTPAVLSNICHQTLSVVSTGSWLTQRQDRLVDRDAALDSVH